jgi:hypothetical protein
LKIASNRNKLSVTNDNNHEQQQTVIKNVDLEMKDLQEQLDKLRNDFKNIEQVKVLYFIYVMKIFYYSHFIFGMWFMLCFVVLHCVRYVGVLYSIVYF